MVSKTREVGKSVSEVLMFELSLDIIDLVSYGGSERP